MTKHSKKKSSKRKPVGGRQQGSGRQVPAPILDGHGRITLSSLLAVAREFGVSAPAVRNWTSGGMPGEAGRYPLREIIEWWAWSIFLKKPEVKQYLEERKEKGPGGRPKKADDENSQELKRQLDIRKIRAEDLKYAEKIGEVMPREHVREFLTRMMGQINNAGELLRKHHGDEAQRIQLDALDAFEKEMETMFKVDNGQEKK